MKKHFFSLTLILAAANLYAQQYVHDSSSTVNAPSVNQTIVNDNSSGNQSQKWVNPTIQSTVTTAAGAANYISKFTTATNIENSVMYEGTGSFVGNIGISNTTPGFKLDITGSSRISGTNSLYLNGQTDALVNGMRLLYNSNGYIDYRGTGMLNFRADNNNGGTTRMSILSTGQVGVGTTAPKDLFQVGTGAYNVTMGSLNGNSTLQYAYSYIGLNAAHTGTNQWKMTSDGANNGGSLMWTNTQGTIYFSNFNNVSPGGSDQVISSDQTIMDHKTMSVAWVSWLNGGAGGGQVTIGKPQTGGIHQGDYALSVNGLIVAKEVWVSTQYFPDYVFDKNYKLKSIEELDQYIAGNHHLPNVPTAKEVEANGMSVGEMNRVLVEKVEELSLYLIEQNKQIKELKEQVSEIQRKEK